MEAITPTPVDPAKGLEVPTATSLAPAPAPGHSSDALTSSPVPAHPAEPSPQALAPPEFSWKKYDPTENKTINYLADISSAGGTNPDSKEAGLALAAPEMAPAETKRPGAAFNSSSARIQDIADNLLERITTFGALDIEKNVIKRTRHNNERYYEQDDFIMDEPEEVNPQQFVCTFDDFFVFEGTKEEFLNSNFYLKRVRELKSYNPNPKRRKAIKKTKGDKRGSGEEGGSATEEGEASSQKKRGRKKKEGTDTESKKSRASGKSRKSKESKESKEKKVPKSPRKPKAVKSETGSVKSVNSRKSKKSEKSQKSVKTVKSTQSKGEKKAKKSVPQTPVVVSQVPGVEPAPSTVQTEAVAEKQVAAPIQSQPTAKQQWNLPSFPLPAGVPEKKTKVAKKTVPKKQDAKPKVAKKAAKGKEEDSRAASVKGTPKQKKIKKAAAAEKPVKKEANITKFFQASGKSPVPKIQEPPGAIPEDSKEPTIHK